LKYNSSKILIFIILAAIISILGGYLIFRATFWGPWAFSDSAAYISAARNIQAGKGAIILNSNGSTTRVTEFPPLFPFILSFLTPKNGDFIEIARWLNIILFSISIFALGSICLIASESLILSLLASILIAISPLMVDTFSGFMSEPLFITMLLLLVFLFLLFLKFQKSTFLISAIIISLLIPLTRYAGILFVICISICLLWFRNKIKQKLVKFVPLYILISLTPIGLWFLDQYNTLNKVGGKRFAINLELIKSIFQSIFQEIKVIGNWIPYSGIYPFENLNKLIIASFSGLFLIIIAFGLINSFKNPKDKKWDSIFLLQICVFFLVAYLIFIGLTHSVSIPKIDIIDRMMAPIYPILVLILLSSFVQIPYEKMSWIIKVCSLIVAIITIRFYAISTLKEVEILHTEGKGYTSQQYQQSGILEKLTSLPEDQNSISNFASFVLFHTNRFPLQVDQFHNRPYGSGNAYGEKSFRENNAALILIYPEFRNYYGEKSYQLLQSLTTGLNVTYQDEIGGIYYYPK
jgi:hypothetical protein